MILQSPLGPLTLHDDATTLTGVTFGADPSGDSGSIAEAAATQIAEYFAGRRRHFDIPLRLGNDFRGHVLRAIFEIPYGCTATYGEIAEEIGHPGAARAVGTVCRTNPFILIVPCHRVVRADGALGRYASPGGTADKEFLQGLEAQVLGREGVDKQ